MDLIDKEVYFSTYCPKCVFADVDEAEDPCARCLLYPSNQHSHKPVEYKPARGNEEFVDSTDPVRVS